MSDILLFCDKSIPIRAKYEMSFIESLLREWKEKSSFSYINVIWKKTISGHSFLCGIPPGKGSCLCFAGFSPDIFPGIKSFIYKFI